MELNPKDAFCDSEHWLTNCTQKLVGRVSLWKSISRWGVWSWTVPQENALPRISEANRWQSWQPGMNGRETVCNSSNRLKWWFYKRTIVTTTRSVGHLNIVQYMIVHEPSHLTQRLVAEIWQVLFFWVYEAHLPRLAWTVGLIRSSIAILLVRLKCIIMSAIYMSCKKHTNLIA